MSRKVTRTKRRHKDSQRDRLSFHMNCAPLLREKLESLGFVQEKLSGKSDFSMWDTHKHYDILSKIKCIGRQILNPLDDKRTMYLRLKELGRTSFLPPTFPYAAQVSENDLDPTKLYFLKEIHGTCGTEVYPVRTMEDIQRVVPGSLRKYVIQEEVPDMILQNDCKVTMRVYVLIADGEIYIYDDGSIYLYQKKYDRDDLDVNIHKWTSNSDHIRYESYSEQPYYKQTFEPMKEICYQTVKPFLNGNLSDRFRILGIDVILCKKLNPYVIEVNTYPNLNHSKTVSVKSKMLQDFIDFYILPKTHNTEPRVGGWILLKYDN